MDNLGFGMMRLPVLNGDPTDFDYEQLNRMVDAFLEAGFTYFDTSAVYHNGKSQEAVRKALVERHPRDSFTVATKFPTFNLVPEDQVEATFQQQLDQLGVEYIDYYLLHNIQTVLYCGVDGKGGIVGQTNLFEHAERWRDEGRIKHLGISFHSSAAVLDRVLAERPEIEFVQIALNPVDWESGFVQAAACYETIRRHGRKVIVMEAVKGGGLAKLPEPAEAILKGMHPDWSIASWSVRFGLSMDDVIAVLSGMSTIEQVEDNVKTCKEAHKLTDQELDALWSAVDIYRASAPITPNQIRMFEGMKWNGVSVAAILQAYSICQIQPDPGFSDDNNYLKNELAEHAHLPMDDKLPRPRVILPDGTDATELVNRAVDWLAAHSF